MLIQSLWFMLPAAVANMTPVFLARFNVLPFLGQPISKKYFGSHKTWRGILGGIMLGLVTVQLQWYFEPQLPSSLLLFGYRAHGLFQSFILGFLLSFGILGMDMVKSFFKRKRGIAPGSKWFPFDSLDSWGALLMGFLMFIPPLHHILTILIGGPIALVIANVFGYFFRLKRVWW